MILNYSSILIAASVSSLCYGLASEDKFDESLNEFEENERIKDFDENDESDDELLFEIRLVIY